MLKATAGASVSAAVWAEPTIRGLARRPAYASTTSTTISTNFTGNQTFVGGAGPSTTLDSQAIANGATTVTVSLTLAGSGTNWTLSASSSDPSCTCTITGGTAGATASLFLFNVDLGIDSTVTGVLSGGVFTFTLPDDFLFFNYRITEIDWNLDVDCV